MGSGGGTVTRKKTRCDLGQGSSDPGRELQSASWHLDQRCRGGGGGGGGGGEGYLIAIRTLGRKSVESCMKKFVRQYREQGTTCV
jgi:hypothetical protein